MTLTLAIDTSTSRTIVGIIDGDEVIFDKFHEGATDHGRALSQLVAEALKVSAPPKQVVAGMGPGPFTGLRVGIAFAQSFALARAIPVRGVCSLDAIAAKIKEADLKQYGDFKAVSLKEIFGAGTAAVVSPIVGFQFQEDYYELCPHCRVQYLEISGQYFFNCINFTSSSP